MNLSFRIGYIAFTLTTSAYMFSYGYVGSIGIPTIPSFETSYYFIISSIFTPNLNFVQSIVLGLLGSFVANYFRLNNSNLWGGIKIVFVVIITFFSVLKYFLYDILLVISFTINAYYVLNPRIISYKECEINFDSKNMFLIFALFAFVNLIFFWFGANLYKNKHFPSIKIVNIKEEHKVRSLWSQAGKLYVIECPPNNQGYFQVPIQEFIDGQKIAIYGDLPRDIYSNICK